MTTRVTASILGASGYTGGELLRLLLAPPPVDVRQVTSERLDRQFAQWLQAWSGIAIGPLLTGSLIALLLAYGVRFMAVAHGPIDSSFERIKPSLWQAARSLGASNREILWRVSIPLLRTGLLSAGLLVFVEVMKEMPATLLLRPFGWDTLATRIFEMTSEGQWERAALPALTLVLAGLIPVVMLVRRSTPQH